MSCAGILGDLTDRGLKRPQHDVDTGLDVALLRPSKISSLLPLLPRRGSPILANVPHRPPQSSNSVIAALVTPIAPPRQDYFSFRPTKSRGSIWTHMSSPERL
jgi:hypothetical protein